MKLRTRIVCHRPLLLLICICLLSCDPNWAKKADKGTVIPNARIQLELPESQTIGQLFSRYVEAAYKGGFFHMVGRSGSITSEEAEASGITLFRWVETQNSNTPYQREISFFSAPREKYADYLTFVFTKESTENFTREDWLEFYRWKDEYLAEVFPKATISIIRHPAVFTDLETITEIEEELGIHVPEEYKSD